MKETDIAEVRHITTLLLYTDIKLCDELAPELHVYHPFFSSSIQKVDNEFVDILKDEKALMQVSKRIAELINTVDIECIYSLVNTPYKMTWYKHISRSLSDADRAKYLVRAWTEEENPNMDPNCPLSYVISEFKRTSKELLMTEKELDFYNNLPDEFPIYRGVSVGRNPKGISYTTNLEKARWFSQRFDSETKTGYILTATGRKEKALAYLNRRDEDELVYDTRKLVTRRLE